MTVPYPQLLSAVAAEFGLAPSAVALYWRMLREAGLEPAGSRGPKAQPVEIGHREAAILLLGLLGSESARGAPDAVNELLGLEFTGAVILPDDAKVKLSKLPRGVELLEGLLAGNILLPNLEFLAVTVRRRDDRACLEFNFFQRDPATVVTLCFGDIAREYGSGFYRSAEIRAGSVATIATAFRPSKRAAVSRPKKAAVRARVCA